LRGSRKIVVGQPQLSRLGERLAGLPFTGDQVGLFRARPGRPKRTWQSDFALASAACRRRSIICGCRRRTSATAGQNEISEPKPYRARNRKFESSSLQQRVFELSVPRRIGKLRAFVGTGRISAEGGMRHALRSAFIWVCRLLSSTIRPGQTRGSRPGCCDCRRTDGCRGLPRAHPASLGRISSRGRPRPCGSGMR